MILVIEDNYRMWNRFYENFLNELGGIDHLVNSGKSVQYIVEMCKLLTGITIVRDPTTGQFKALQFDTAEEVTHFILRWS